MHPATCTHSYTHIHIHSHTCTCTRPYSHAHRNTFTSAHKHIQTRAHVLMHNHKHVHCDPQTMQIRRVCIRNVQMPSVCLPPSKRTNTQHLFCLEVISPSSLGSPINMMISNSSHCFLFILNLCFCAFHFIISFHWILSCFYVVLMSWSARCVVANPNFLYTLYYAMWVWDLVGVVAGTVVCTALALFSIRTHPA